MGSIHRSATDRPTATPRSLLAAAATSRDVPSCSAVLGADAHPERECRGQGTVVFTGHLPDRRLAALAQLPAQRVAATVKLLAGAGRDDDEHEGVQLAVTFGHGPLGPLQRVDLLHVLDADVSVALGRRRGVVSAADRATRVALAVRPR